ncbi:TPA: hypothetical protein EYN98_23650 [Candidatus Poribacteria bacterium]|nr:hypothetical protein [Candidatus Poribacteria bacterium]HIA68975.1 hypothetical protein [Candidatus Poribacteria bacterium]
MCFSTRYVSYPAIIGRWIDQPIINLGFSGNGQAEPEMAKLLAELDPAVVYLGLLSERQRKRNS